MAQIATPVTDCRRARRSGEGFLENLSVLLRGGVAQDAAPVTDCRRARRSGDVFFKSKRFLLISWPSCEVFQAPRSSRRAEFYRIRKKTKGEFCVSEIDFS
jgi:hypothetical protein